MQFLLRTPSSDKLMHSVSMHARIDSLRVNAIVFLKLVLVQVFIKEGY